MAIGQNTPDVNDIVGWTPQANAPLGYGSAAAQNLGTTGPGQPDAGLSSPPVPNAPGGEEVLVNPGYGNPGVTLSQAVGEVGDAGKSSVLPSGDTTGATDTAAIQAALANGTAQLAYGTYYVTNITIDSLQSLTGVGEGTVLQAVSGTTGYMIALADPATTYRVTVSDLTLLPDTGSLGGIELDNTGFTSGGGETDTLHILSNVLVKGAGGDAFHLGANIRSLRASGCAAYTSGGYGWYLAVGTTDSFFTGCVSGVSADHGWCIDGWNNMFSACKSFYAGYSNGAYGTTGCGFEITGQFNTLASCSAQSNALHGFDLNGCVSCTIAAGEGDANGAGTAGVGVNINGATYCTVSGVVGGTSSTETQTYGVQVSGTNTDTWITCCNITGTVAEFNWVSGGGYLLQSAVTTDFSSIQQLKLLSGSQFGSGSHFYSGTGAPNISSSVAGDFYFRTDATSTSDARIYVATAANTWTGIA